ncbi:MAG: family 1 glycosylhydrolase [Candidatus Jorgensenbacteria bacterium]|nr:family 1 glycosylhydrolase [Candidatus Jorgensenbacteria bacterium]
MKFFNRSRVHFLLLVLVLLIPLKYCPSHSRVNSTKSPPNISVRENKASTNNLIFSENFTWGVATSAFQTDGGNGKTDWDAWSKYKKSHPTHPGLTKEDIKHAREIGIQELRFSIEWARVEPQEGLWDEKELSRYYDLALEIESQKIRPLINLHHLTIPKWVADKGGLESENFPALFSIYAKRVAAKMRPLKIKRWMTFNEPMVPIEMGYLNGLWPPLKKMDIAGANRAEWNIIRAHKLAYKEIHRELNTAFIKPEVGVAYFDHLYIPRNSNDRDDVRVAELLDAKGRAMMDALCDHVEYIGINYYSPCVVAYSEIAPGRNNMPIAASYHRPKGKVTEEGMVVFPEGIRLLAMRYKKYGKPIIITENGIGDRTDKLRGKFIIDHLRELHVVSEELKNTASPIIGYFYWTLADNFEWEKFHVSAFGLIAVNTRTNVRTVRKSAYLYRDIISANGVTEKMLNDYK